MLRPQSIFLSFCLGILASSLWAQSHVWSQRFGHFAQLDEGHAVAVSGSGNVFVTGRGPTKSVRLLGYDSNGGFLWSQGFGGNGPTGFDIDHGSGVATDGSGNVIITGRFHEMVDFGGGPHTSTGSSDLFVAQFDSLGAYIWSSAFGDTLSDEGFAVAVDGSDHVVLAGSFQGTVDFGGGALASAGLDDIVVAKFDSNGNHVWSQAFGSSGRDFGYGITVDDFGNVIMTGAAGTVDFGGGPLQVGIFVAKLDSMGNHVWSQGFGDGMGSDVGRAVAIDTSGNIIVTGDFVGTVDFGGGPLTGSGNIFIAKFNSMGNHIWSRSFAGSGANVGWGVGVDGSGNVSVTGQFQGTMSLGGGPMTSAGSSEIYLAKYDPMGDHLWSQRFGSNGADGGRAVAIDGFDNVVVTGEFQNTVDFGGGPLSSAGSDDIFVAKYGDPPTSAMLPRVLVVLHPNRPNPFNPLTRIDYSVYRSTHVKLSIYDVAGKRVRTLVDVHRRAGAHSIAWDGRDDQGTTMPSGIYTVLIQAEGRAHGQKAVLVK